MQDSPVARVKNTLPTPHAATIITATAYPLGYTKGVKAGHLTHLPDVPLSYGDRS